MLEILFGWGSKASPLAIKLSKIKPGSGRAIFCNTVGFAALAYGVFAIPISGLRMLLYEPSASRYLYLVPRLVRGGWGSAFQRLLMKAPVSWFESLDVSSSLLRSWTRCSRRNLLSSCWPLTSEFNSENRVSTSLKPIFRRSERSPVIFVWSSLFGV